MKFGSREICNVVFRAKSAMRIGNVDFIERQPVLYMDSAKTSTLEGAATSVYATGGRGNTRLVTWEGEKTLTFTVEDALLSPISFSMLSGAGVVKGGAGNVEKTHVHMVTNTSVTVTGDSATIDMTNILGTDEVCADAPIFITKTEKDGSLTGVLAKDVTFASGKFTLKKDGFANGDSVMIDYYVLRNTETVTELQIDAEHFGGYFYVEAETLFRKQENGKDMPAIITIPNVKIQSNFTFSMASTGDPSTFTFTMDAMPGYTYFNNTKKVLCVIQVIDDEDSTDERQTVLMGEGSSNGNTHPTVEKATVGADEPEEEIDSIDRVTVSG